MKRSLLLLLIILLFLAESAFSNSLEEEIAGLFIVGFPGKEMNSSLRELIDMKVGGFILYSYNVLSKEQVEDLIKEIKKEGDFLIFIDQEGSYVSRIKKGVFVPPNAMALGSSNDPFLSYLCGYLTGRDLKELGIDVNIAPVLDVNTNPLNSVISVRAFWSEPERVIKNGIAFMRGLLASGILPVIKHFPGHGSTITDSHIGLPVVIKSETSYVENDIYPFKEAIKSGAPIVMVGHILLPFWDNVPATISNKVIRYLREELNFNGLIISDEMSMGAIMKSKNGISDAIIKAFSAGINMVIVSDGSSVKKIINDVISAINTGKLPLKRIEESLNKIKEIKNYAKKIEPINLSIDPAWVMKKVMKNSVALKGNFRLEKGKKYLILSLSETDEVLKMFVKRMNLFGIKVSMITLNEKNFLRVNPNEFDGLLIFTKDMYKYSKYVEKINKFLQMFPNNVVIALRSPYDILFIDKDLVKCYSAVYDWNKYSMETLFNILMGLEKSKGDFPFSVDISQGG